MKNKQIGIILILVGAFMTYWAQTHSPKAGIGQIVGNQLSGSYTMSENGYYFSMAVAVATLAYGIYRFMAGK